MSLPNYDDAAESCSILFPDASPDNNLFVPFPQAAPPAVCSQQELIEYFKAVLRELHAITCRQIESHNLVKEAVAHNINQANACAHISKLLVGHGSGKSVVPGVLDTLIGTKTLEQIVSQLKLISDTQTKLHGLMSNLVENNKELMVGNGQAILRVDKLIEILSDILNTGRLGTF